MWNSTSRVTENGTKYEVGQLDLFVNILGFGIESEEDSADSPLPKDAENNFHNIPFLNGITNGEYLYCAFQIITEMLNDEAAKDPLMYKEAVLASILDCAEVDFLERYDSDFFDNCLAQDIWDLWKACRANNKLPVWEDENGQPVESPSLKEIPKEEWENIFEFIRDEFLWDRDWEIPLFGGNLALVTEQPHWPNDQEYRTAKTWLVYAYNNTRANRKEEGSKKTEIEQEQHSLKERHSPEQKKQRKKT